MVDVCIWALQPCLGVVFIRVLSLLRVLTLLHDPLVDGSPAVLQSQATDGLPAKATY